MPYYENIMSSIQVSLIVISILPVQIFKSWFWMGHYDHPSPKRTALWSNSKIIAFFWKGRMTKAYRKMLKAKNPEFQPVVKYQDAKGHRRFHGTKHLTQTQKLGCMKACKKLFIFCMVKSPPPRLINKNIDYG